MVDELNRTGERVLPSKETPYTYAEIDAGVRKMRNLGPNDVTRKKTATIFYEVRPHD